MRNVKISYLYSVKERRKEYGRTLKLVFGMRDECRIMINVEFKTRQKYGKY